MRFAAVQALAQLAAKGDQHAITAISAHLEDEDAFVRCAAVEALAELEGCIP